MCFVLYSGFKNLQKEISFLSSTKGKYKSGCTFPLYATGTS